MLTGQMIGSASWKVSVYGNICLIFEFEGHHFGFRLPGIQTQVEFVVEDVTLFLIFIVSAVYDVENVGEFFERHKKLVLL